MSHDRNREIITIGLCPAWDIVCKGENLEWGEHKVITEATIKPAGKALNISKALAWLGEKNTVTGLWGKEDYSQMLDMLEPLKNLLKTRFIAVEGQTRRNITVIDTACKKEIHLRDVSALVSGRTIAELNSRLQKIVSKNNICIFAGSIPQGQLLNDILKLVELCYNKYSKIAIDTSGKTLKVIVNSNRVWLIKPNVEEMSELLGKKIKDNPLSLKKTACCLLGKVEIILISRGVKGAVVVTREQTWQGKWTCAGKKVPSTVGCGDYLLAGFIKELKVSNNIAVALETALKVATAHALGWTEKIPWQAAQRKIKVRVDKI